MVSGRPDAHAPAGRSVAQPRLPGELTSAGELLVAVRLTDLDLARLGVGQDRDPDLQDAVVVAGVDRVGVEGPRRCLD
jgi:hypothetical protein